MHFSPEVTESSTNKQHHLSQTAWSTHDFSNDSRALDCMCMPGFDNQTDSCQLCQEGFYKESLENVICVSCLQESLENVSCTVYGTGSCRIHCGVEVTESSTNKQLSLRCRSIGRGRVRMQAGLYASCVCVLLLQDLLQSCARGGRRRVEDMCYERRLAEACVDESAHHALVNAGGREIV